MAHLTYYVKSDVMRHYSPVREETLWSGARLPPSVLLVDAEEEQFAMRLGAVIAKVRLDQDISQEDLAGRLGVSIAALGRWERGVNPPKAYQLAKLWSELGCSAEWLLNPADSMSPVDRMLAEAVERGRTAAYRPRRRATRRADDERGGPRAPRRSPDRRGSQ